MMNMKSVTGAFVALVVALAAVAATPVAALAGAQTYRAVWTHSQSIRVGIWFHRHHHRHHHHHHHGW